MFLLGSHWDPIVCNDIVIAHDLYINKIWYVISRNDLDLPNM